MASAKDSELAMNMLKTIKKKEKFLRAIINRISEMVSARHSTSKRPKLNTTGSLNSTLDMARENFTSPMVFLNMTVIGKIINDPDKVNFMTKKVS